MVLIVLANNRKIASVQFVTTAINLAKDVRSWCLSQGRRQDNYGLVQLYDSISRVVTDTIYLNNIYANSIDNVTERLRLNLEARRYLREFNCLVTALYPVCKLKHKRAKRWGDLSNQEARLLEGLYKADQNRLTRLRK